MNAIRANSASDPQWSRDNAEASSTPLADSHAVVALRRLARDSGAHIKRGALTLAGVSWPAWLAMTGDGLLLAAVLSGERAPGEESIDDRQQT
jgi:hypothetical protein